MKTNTIWALVTGLAVGFLVGREFGGKSDGGGAKPGSSGSSSGGGSAAAPGEIPKDWLGEAELKAGEKMAGMTAAQKYAALKVMNEKPCDCGCPHGSTAKCLKDDPACPRAPKILEQAIALAKEGKSADQILAAVKKPDAPAAAPQAPAGPQKIEVAAWNPVKGPKDAKVTIIEFSDFQ
jgi:hypothetical protein